MSLFEKYSTKIGFHIKKILSYFTTCIPTYLNYILLRFIAYSCFGPEKCSTDRSETFKFYIKAHHKIFTHMIFMSSYDIMEDSDFTY